MIFEGRPVDEISDEEIAQLVKAHVSERQHLEFKATLGYKDDDARMELLRDVVSMANGGGGYLVFGVRDDGRGQAQSFVDQALMNRADSMIKSIRSLCHDHCDRPPIVVPPTVLVQPPPEAWGEGRRVSGVSGRPDRAGSLPEPGAGSPESYEDGWCCTRAATVR